MLPVIFRWLAASEKKMSKFIEPFVGGGGVSLAIAEKRMASKIVMVELDPDVACVWETILHNPAGTNYLINKINRFRINRTSVKKQLQKKKLSPSGKAFNTILRNRVSHAGKLVSGGGFIRNGENGKGMRSRWYKDTLIARIEQVQKISGRIQFVRGDGLKIIEMNKYNEGVSFFVDPPYSFGPTSAGARLYNYSTIDHEKLFQLLKTIKGRFLMTYDNSKEVRKLVKAYGFVSKKIRMKTAHHNTKYELIISRDLSWY